MADISPEIEEAIQAASDNANTLGAVGLSALLSLITDWLGPIVGCVTDFGPLGDAVDALLGLGTDSCLAF